MEVKLSPILKEEDLVEFDLFTKKSTMVDTLVDLKNLEASANLINFVIRKQEWRGYQYNRGLQIGYGTKQKVDDIGLIESEAFNFWIDGFKATERRFKGILGNVSQLTQTQYDALLSVYYHTGDIFNIGSATRTFKVQQYIENKQWQYYASALILSGFQRNIRQGEAKIMMLADYGRTKDRSVIKSEGLQRIRQLYPRRFDTPRAKEQAEYVYYAETKRFLPKMTQTRMRQVVALYKESSTT